MNQSDHIVIAGGSGFLGLSLAKHLAQLDYQVVIIARNQPVETGPWTFVKWDGRTIGDWSSYLEQATAIVNLAGRTVDCIKTPSHCDEILRSRVEATKILGQAIRTLQSPPRVWVQMSTAHRYGDPPEVICDEDSAFGIGLAPIVGQAWEEEFAKAVLPKMRQVILRTSFVLGNSGGALPRLAKLVRWCLGGKVGHGRQGISWIHMQDMNRLFARAISEETMSGAYLATAPAPVSNKEFMKELRHALNVPLGLPVANWMVKVGAPLVMRTDPDLGLYGRYCISKRLKKERFEFLFPDLKSALNNLYR